MDKILRKINIWLPMLLMAAVLLAYIVPVALAADEDSCGDDLTWDLNGGTLTIVGSGEMTDFVEPDMAPWYEQREEILRVSLSEGMTSVGDLAFYGCKNLSAVALPNSVEKVGDYSFAECSAITVLKLGSALKTIGNCAFMNCNAIRSLELPEGLRSIGLKGFYRCETITSLVLPSSLTEVGISAFAYCKNLVSAQIKSDIKEIPEFLFYGCEKLSAVSLPSQIALVNDFSFRGCNRLDTVYFNGEDTALEQLKEAVATANAVVSGDAPAISATGSSAELNDDGTITHQSITVVQAENTFVSTTVEQSVSENMTILGEPVAKVQITIDSDDNWTEAAKLVSDSFEELEERFAEHNISVKTEINLDIKSDAAVDPGFVDAMAGQNGIMAITTTDGSVWKIDLSQLDDGARANRDDRYDLRYALSEAQPEICEQLGAETALALRFNAPAQVNAEVLVSMGSDYARRNATLFKLDGKKLERYQTVVVDDSGVAHLHLASVSDKNDYYIAMDLGAQEDGAVIPEELFAEYGAGTMRYAPIQYEITGRKSTWGMNISQVTWIMIIVLFVVVVSVGMTMFVLNRRKLKNGYIPNLEDGN